jgi:hypothetical protein
VESANLGERLVDNFPLTSMDTNKGQSVVNNEKLEGYVRPA